jgi:hypothetical protein
VPDHTVPDHTVPDHTVPDHTVPDHTASGHTSAGAIPARDAGPGRRGGGTGDAHEPPAWFGWLRRRPGWLAVAVASLGIFVGVIGGITVFEVAAGKPLDAVVWHHPGSGTTVGGLIGGQPSRPAATAHHRAPPSHRASPSPSPSSTGTGSPSPSATPTSPSPTKSPSPTPTTPSPTPTPSGKAGS